jgi:hypothetical protein
MVEPMLDTALVPALDSGACPHLAVLLRNDAEFAPVVASFYSLGAKRGGFLAHRAVEVDRDREALTEAGLDVAGLESENQLVIEQIDLDEPPDRLPERLEAAFDDALGRGFTGLWSSHSPVGSEAGAYERAMSIERAWEERFGARQVVTLCPYVVEGLDAAAAIDRFADLAGHHDGVVVPSEERHELFKLG